MDMEIKSYIENKIEEIRTEQKLDGSIWGLRLKWFGPADWGVVYKGEHYTPDFGEEVDLEGFFERVLALKEPTSEVKMKKLHDKQRKAMEKRLELEKEEEEKLKESEEPKKDKTPEPEKVEPEKLDEAEVNEPVKEPVEELETLVDESTKPEDLEKPTEPEVPEDAPKETLGGSYKKRGRPFKVR